MAEAKSVPVLFVSDPVVLPGMVVPIALDDAARAAVDAARATESGTLLIAPRLDDRYPSYGVLATIVQVGRIPGGGTAAVVRGERRAHIGAGTSGPGAALGVEVTEVTDPEPTDETRSLAGEYKKLLLAMLQRVSTATLSSQLYRRGFRQLVMENVAPLRPDLTMAGQAVTLLRLSRDMPS